MSNNWNDKNKVRIGEEFKDSSSNKQKQSLNCENDKDR